MQGRASARPLFFDGWNVRTERKGALIGSATFLAWARSLQEPLMRRIASSRVVDLGKEEAYRNLGGRAAFTLPNGHRSNSLLRRERPIG